MDDAACAQVDPELFYPQSEHATEEYREAAKICAGCPAKADCLADAMRRGDPHGMWGGLDPEQRKQLAKGQGTTLQLIRKEARIEDEYRFLVAEWEGARRGGMTSGDMARRYGVSRSVYEKRIQRARNYMATGFADRSRHLVD